MGGRVVIPSDQPKERNILSIFFIIFFLNFCYNSGYLNKFQRHLYYNFVIDSLISANTCQSSHWVDIPKYWKEPIFNVWSECVRVCARAGAVSCKLACLRARACNYVLSSLVLITVFMLIAALQTMMHLLQKGILKVTRKREKGNNYKPCQKNKLWETIVTQHTTEKQHGSFIQILALFINNTCAQFRTLLHLFFRTPKFYLP